MNRHNLYLLLLFLLIATCSSALSLDPLKGVTVLLDPGHGGTDPGAIGPTGLKESETNLRVARYLMDLLVADGATVHLTRNSDVYLTLGQRIEIAKKLQPDLFVSIHHNASLKPRKTNRSEIYYNALDQGLSQIAGQKMIERLESHGFGEESMIVPGGFFVLRNNPSPSVLTEGSYISIPDIEKQLKTGKALTNQAEALRQAIREAFANGPLKIQLFASEAPVKIDTTFFNFIFTSNKPIIRVRARLGGSDLKGFGFDLLPSVGNTTYRIYNTVPLTSGHYELQLTFYAKDGTIAPRINLPLEVALPFGHSQIKAIAPFIPAGFKGKFPIQVILRDEEGKLNLRAEKIAVFYGEKGEIVCETDPDGETTVLLDLTGDESGYLETRVVYDCRILAHGLIPIRRPDRRMYFGRVIDESGNGIAKTQILFGNDMAVSIDGGYFCLTYPMLYNNMKLKLYPPTGYVEEGFWIRTQGEPVFIENLQLSRIAPTLLGKKIGIMAIPGYEKNLTSLISELEKAGVEVTTLNMPANMAKPEYQAVVEINLKNNFDLILSFKNHKGRDSFARHYHRGGKGKQIADMLAKKLRRSRPRIALNVGAGSDYEISHTGATSIVFDLPGNLRKGHIENFHKHLIEVLKSAL